MQHDTAPVLPLGGMGLHDHEMTSSRLAMLGELAHVAYDEALEVYGEDSGSAQAARRIVEAAEDLRLAMQAHAQVEHPATRQALYAPFSRPSRPVRPGCERAGQTG